MSASLHIRCDGVVRLPCRGVKNSMNVGVAVGMCGYEITTQWEQADAADEVQTVAMSSRAQSSRAQMFGMESQASEVARPSGVQTTE